MAKYHSGEDRFFEHRAKEHLTPIKFLQYLKEQPMYSLHLPVHINLDSTKYILDLKEHPRFIKDRVLQVQGEGITTVGDLCEIFRNYIRDSTANHSYLDRMNTPLWFAESNKVYPWPIYQVQRYPHHWMLSTHERIL